MPHLTIVYTPGLDLDPAADLPGLCRALAETLLAVRDEAGAQVFPTGGVRVLATPAAHAAVADGRAGLDFAYFNLRMARGRSAAVHAAAGEALAATLRRHFAPLLARRPIGLTLQIDEGHEVFDAKLGNLHALFTKAP